MIEPTDLDDPRLESYRWVVVPARLADQNLFVAEGRLVVRRLLPLAHTPGHRFEGVVESVLVTPAAAAELADLISAWPAIAFYQVPQASMNRLVGFNIHRGCLAMARRPPAVALKPTMLTSVRSMVVLEGVNNPDNLGGIARSAAAFGVDLIVLGPGTADPLYRKAIRTSMGATLAVPYVDAGAWPEAIQMIREAGLRTIALTPNPAAEPLATLIDDQQPYALLAGAEGHGLSAEALAGVDRLARIPMTSLVDSLNVATAVSIALYHFSRGLLR